MSIMPYPAANPKKAPSTTSPAMPNGDTGGAPFVATQTMNPTTHKNPSSEPVMRMMTSGGENGSRGYGRLRRHG